MTKQEINEYLAERLLGLTHYDDGICNSRAEGVSSYCDCVCLRQDYCMNYAPDYIKNCQPVIEKLQTFSGEFKNCYRDLDVKIHFDGRTKKHICIIESVQYGDNKWSNFGHCLRNGNMHRAEGDSIGETICRAAVEYLKSREGKE